ATAEAAAPYLTLLAVGTMLNGVMSTPYSLVLAFGRTRLLIGFNGILVVLCIPGIYFGVSMFGAIAAGYVWIAVAASGVIVAVPLMHRKVMGAEKWRWYGEDFGLPAAAAFLAVYAVQLAMPGPAAHDHVTDVLVVALAWLLSSCAATLVSPLGREGVLRGL